MRRVSHLALSAALALSAVLLLQLLSPVAAAASKVPPTPNSVVVNADGTMTVDGSPFKIKGVAYSPVPVGESVHFAPNGDYFTSQYLYIWSRDLAALRAMGVNTLRIYAWDNDVDHSTFLDACTQFGMKVMLTHYVGNSKETPVSTPEQRQAAIDSFVKHVAMLGDHPAILAWSFGNELNGVWNGFIGDFSVVGKCGWAPTCLNAVDTASVCHAQQKCVYEQMFGWFNAALGAAKKVSTRPMTSTFADVDMLIGSNPNVDRIPRFESLLPNMDMYAIQLYRGQSFKAYFEEYAKETSKPLLIGEYGVDAFNDPCGWPENFETMRPCYNTGANPGLLGGAAAGPNFKGCSQTNGACKQPGETTQVEWNTNLAKEILASPVTIGGILMEWHDENWKNIGTEDKCATPCPKGKEVECADPSSSLYASLAMGGSGGCTYKAHVTCSNYDTMVHDLCGYYLGSAPDQYVNEAWFGLNAAEDCGITDPLGAHRLTVLKPRPVVAAITSVFGGKGGVAPKTCAELKPCWSCSLDSTEAQILAGGCDTACGVKFAGGSTPVDPDTPGTPTDPDTPGTPTDPDTPGTPTDPDTPGTPTDPDTPGTPTDPDTPGTPKDPTKKNAAQAQGFSTLLLAVLAFCALALRV